jgi:hypothetical protein
MAMTDAHVGSVVTGPLLSELVGVLGLVPMGDGFGAL